MGSEYVQPQHSTVRQHPAETGTLLFLCLNTCLYCSSLLSFQVSITASSLPDADHVSHQTKTAQYA
jgi:hypothetical protein